LLDDRSHGAIASDRGMKEMRSENEEFDWDEPVDDEERPEGYSTVRGYVWYAYPSTEFASDCPFAPYVPNSGQQRGLNYYGPISTAEGLVNPKKSGAYLCITSDDSAPRVLPGWEIEPAELNPGFEAHDIGTIRLVREIRRRQPDYEPFSQYEFETWD
jgi:hypothetical protein